MLTATVWEDRLLGRSEQICVPVLATWVATGNNPALSEELARRTVRIRLDSKTDRPWLRDGFRHDNLRAWANDRRGELIRAALVLWQGWLDAGRPLGRGPSSSMLGMFESWGRVLGGVLCYAEMVGFLDNLEEFDEGTDDEGGIWRRFLGIWFDRFGDAETGVSDLWPLVQPSAGDPIDIDLGKGSERSQKTRLGKLMGQMRDRQFGPYRIVKGNAYQGARVTTAKNPHP